MRIARAGCVPGAKKVGREWRFPPGRTDILPIRPEASLLNPGSQRRSSVTDRRRLGDGASSSWWAEIRLWAYQQIWYDVFMSHKEQVTIGARGRLVLPASVRSALGLRPGTRMLLSTEDDGSLRLRSYRAVADQSRGLFSDLAEGSSLVDELLAERRAEARREE